MATGLSPQSHSDSACAAGLISPPGEARVDADGVIYVNGADLDYVNLGGRSSLHIHAKKRRLCVRHGRDHRITPAGTHGKIHARRELRSLRVDFNQIQHHPPRVVRHSDGHARWLELRFDPESLVPRARKHPHGDT